MPVTLSKGMGDDELLGMVGSLQQQRIQFNQMEEQIQTMEAEADTLDEQLQASNFTIAAILARELIKVARQRTVYSVILLALVDHRYLYRYVNVGFPGKCHDANVYGRSPLARLLESYQAAVPRVMGGTEIPPLVLCDQAFSLTQNLMKPFRHSLNYPQGKRDYNYALSKARRVVENTFGRLKARFRILPKRMEQRMENVNAVVRACCILHNVCETLNDRADQQWVTEALKIGEDAKQEQPSLSSLSATDRGDTLRAALVSYFEANPLRTRKA
ncbi:putative nuclease HARBI1 [Ixodes scapularis]|uniref:putative nuclease HARBI1 n=1 Tax=Ixodes scapularis TaxID=6945 RepID=UPI001A9FF727|nr:putative nuclease HARBI1 [Ixodes scapularis]